MRVELAGQLAVVMAAAAQRLLDFADALGRRRPLPPDYPPAPPAPPADSVRRRVFRRERFFWVTEVFLLLLETFFAGFAGEALAGGACKAEAPAARTKPVRTKLARTKPARIAAKYRAALPGIAANRILATAPLS